MIPLHGDILILYATLLALMVGLTVAVVGLCVVSVVASAHRQRLSPEGVTWECPRTSLD